MRFTFLERIKAAQMLELAKQFDYPDEIRYWTAELDKLTV